VLSIEENIEIDYVIKAPIKNNENFSAIEKLASVNVINPFVTYGIQSPRLAVNEAVDILEKLNNEKNYDGIILRGLELCLEAASRNTLKNKILSYVTNFNHDKESIEPNEVNQLSYIYENSKYMFAQTEEAQNCLMNIIEPKQVNKFRILSPMIPDYEIENQSLVNKGNTLIYSGKFAKDWYTKEIIDAFKKINDINDEITLTFVGNKFQGELVQEKDQITQELKSNNKINWIKGVSREESNKLIQKSDLGIAWRSSNVDNDDSVELSTKVLEYCLAGKPVLLRRTILHEKLLGSDYPLFVETEEEFISKILMIFENSDLYSFTAERCYYAAQQFTFSERAKSLHQTWWSLKRNKIRVAVAGHDLKFINSMLTYLTENKDLEIKIDHWSNHNSHDEKLSNECIEWADIILCEWGLGNAVWYSNNKKRYQKLFVRMHGQERKTKFPPLFNYDNIDNFVAISPFIYEEFSRIIDTPRDKMKIIYNYVDSKSFDKPKLPGAEYNLGIAGISPQLKRLDRAIDIFEKLWERDNRYKLYIKGKRPEEYKWWTMKKGEETEYYNNLYKRIDESPWKGNVIFDGHGNDMAIWFQKIGFILSTSDYETFHLAPAEGMASGSVPIIFNWSGSKAIYEKKWIVSNVDDAVKHVLDYKNSVGNDSLKAYIREHYGIEKIANDLLELIQK
ncbi:glycosyltransferase, partial [Neobacillus drentensis]|uniref:glycosyltransferase n=1 Tax=Neobacillus drentensis TaxID=220684 RepID=UPI002FFDD677